MAGLIASIAGGIGEGMLQSGRQLGDYVSRSAIQEEAAKIQAQRDQVIAQLQKERDQRLAGERREEIRYTDDLRRAPGKRAEESAQGLIGKRMQEIQGARTTEQDATQGPSAIKNLSPQEEARIRAEAYGKEGLSSEASTLRREALEAERLDADRSERSADRLDRQADRDLRDRRDREQHEERMKTLGRQIGLEERKIKILEDNNVIEKEDKKIIRDARDAYLKETDPEKKAELGASYMTLLGKAGERWEAIKERDPTTGDVVTTGFLDKLTGRRMGPKGKEGADAPKTGAKWDSETGDVLLDGKRLGSAKSRAEAMALIAKARGTK